MPQLTNCHCNYSPDYATQRRSATEIRFSKKLRISLRESMLPKEG